MSDQLKEPSRLELFKAGKIEERKSPRRPHVLEQSAPDPAAQKAKSIFLRPELIALAILAAFLLILALVGIN